MTTPTILQDTSVSTPKFPDEAAIVALPVPGELYVARPEVGQRQMVFSQYDLSRARMAGGHEIAPTWSDPQVAIETYRLGQLVETAERLLKEVFGDSATVKPEIEGDPESGVPMLILRMMVPRTLRDRRYDFLDKYANDVSVPSGAPAPVVMWDYSGAVPA